MEAMIFMILFGALLLLASFSLLTSKDPRESIFLSRSYGIKNMPLNEAKTLAKKISKILAIIGAAIIIISGVAILIMR